VWTPLSRGSDGRFVAPVSRQTKNQQQFVTYRAVSRALPPSLGLRLVPFSVPSIFVRWRSSEEQKQAGNGRKGKNNEISPTWPLGGHNEE